MFFVDINMLILLILIFIREIVAELVMLLANEKTFRDRDSGFVEILSYRLWDNQHKTSTQEDKIKKFYLLLLFNYKY